MSAGRHLGVLDGWRGISILLVLASHLLPLGPKAWGLNETAGPMGMALFFTLSGFLITRMLMAGVSVPDFLVRRLFRIVPIAWVSMAVAFPLAAVAGAQYLPNFFFYANLPPIRLPEVSSHFWSLCVEMQFYGAIALVVLVFGRRGLLALPVLCVAVTLYRVSAGAYVDIVTWKRVDEILAGGVLALIHGGHLGAAAGRVVRQVPIVGCLLLFIVSSHPDAAFMNYVRPYAAALLVGSTLYAAPARLVAVLESRPLRYIAAISFALYVFHGLLVSTWLGSGDRLVKYLKRPLLFAATFALAHASTFHFEKHWIRAGKRLSERWQPPAIRDA